MEAELRLGARHQDGPALLGADPALELGLVALEVGAAGTDLDQLARVVNRGGLPGVHQPGDGEERHEPHGDPVASLNPHPPPRPRPAPRTGRADSRAPRRTPAAPAASAAPGPAAVP